MSERITTVKKIMITDANKARWAFPNTVIIDGVSNYSEHWVKILNEHQIPFKVGYIQDGRWITCPNS